MEIHREDKEDLWASVMESYYDISGKTMSKKVASEIVQQLPDSIFHLAAQWGADDTEVRDRIYVWVRDEYGTEE